jgi:hypothetical protein
MPNNNLSSLKGIVRLGPNWWNIYNRVLIYNKVFDGICAQQISGDG